MNQVGKIKLMSKKLTSKECNELSEYFRDEVGKKWRIERNNEVLSLGVGGRVVYYTSNSNYDVTGKQGTIKAIYKRRGHEEMVLEVEFDSPVWSKKHKQITEEFNNWWKEKSAIPTEKERIHNQARQMKYRSIWTSLRKIYEKETGLPSQKEYTNQGSRLININPIHLRPATEENIRNAESTRKNIPMMNALNKAIGNMFNKK